MIHNNRLFPLKCKTKRQDDPPDTDSCQYPAVRRGNSKVNTPLEVITQIMVLMEGAKLGAWLRENIKLMTCLRSQILSPLLLSMRWTNHVSHRKHLCDEDAR